MTRPPWDPEQPFQDLRLLPPGFELETKEVLKACITARAALAELSQAVRLIPNQNILISTLPLLEAQASSEIENIVTTADKLFRSLPNSSAADPYTREALRYREALLAGFVDLAHRPLGTRTAETIASRIRDVTMRVRNQEEVSIVNHRTGQTIYTPPRGEQLLRDLLRNWEQFMHEGTDELDPLVKMAVAHYQFEAIHPFTDGNGRTGRILNTLYLIEQGLLSAPVLYLSRYINQRRSEYYRLLLAVTTEAAWESWVLYMVDAVAETASWTLAKIAAVRTLMETVRDHFRHELPQIFRQDLLDLIFEWPYIRIANIVDQGLAVRQTASRYLQELTRIGVLQEVRSGREKLFVNTRLLELLTSESNNFKPFTG